jgi:predicted RNA binding protein YcfA (HicA-like mRNA interferase family)
MMNKQQASVTFKDLTSLLNKLGFINRKTTGNHVVFEYPATGFLVVLPLHKASDLVPMRHLIGIRSQLDELGLMSMAAFDGLAEKITS